MAGANRRLHLCAVLQVPVRVPSLEIIDRYCDRYEWAKSEITGSLQMVDQPNCNSKMRRARSRAIRLFNLEIITLCYEYQVNRVYNREFSRPLFLSEPFSLGRFFHLEIVTL